MTTLNYTVLDAGENAAQKTVTLVTGDTEAVLIDPGFTLATGHRAVANILDSGKNLTTVIITTPDPDYFFASQVIQDAFPQAVFTAPADVVDHINEHYEEMVASSAALGVNLPTRKVDLVPLEVDSITIDDATLDVKHVNVLPQHRGWYLFDGISRTLLGGILIFGGTHVWTAHTPTQEQRAVWMTALNELESLAPAIVIAGHRDPGFPTDISAIRFTRDYLAAFDTAIETSDTADIAETRLKEQFPNAGLLGAVHLGTRVAKGEMTWG